MYSLKKYENIYLSVSYDFSKFNGLGKSRFYVPSGPPKNVFALPPSSNFTYAIILYL
jgi:hypothetical protein